MKTHEGLLPPTIMLRFPSGTAAKAFGDWVPNHVGLEQVLGLAGLLDPEFVEVEDLLFWNPRAGGENPDAGGGAGAGGVGGLHLVRQ